MIKAFSLNIYKAKLAKTTMCTGDETMKIEIFIHNQKTSFKKYLFMRFPFFLHDLNAHFTKYQNK